MRKSRFGCPERAPMVATCFPGWVDPPAPKGRSVPRYPGTPSQSCLASCIMLRSSEACRRQPPPGNACICSLIQRLSHSIYVQKASAASEWYQVFRRYKQEEKEKAKPSPDIIAAQFSRHIAESSFLCVNWGTMPREVDIVLSLSAPSFGITTHGAFSLTNMCRRTSGISHLKLPSSTVPIVKLVWSFPLNRYTIETGVPHFMQNVLSAVCESNKVLRV